MTLSDQLINECFMKAWSQFGDEKSTDFLVQFTADQMKLSAEQVYDALAAVHDAEQT